jgi:hypothetical protein
LAFSLNPQQVCPRLRRRQPTGDGHRCAGETELPGHRKPGVAGEDHHLLVDDDRLPPAMRILSVFGLDRTDALLCEQSGGNHATAKLF